MKILICGKGGSGKSTVASLLAKDLQKKGYRILVVDTDESNYGLSAQLGLKDPKELLDQIGGKKALGQKMMAARSCNEKLKIFPQEWQIDDIPADCISKKDNLYLLQIGKVKHFGEGCACPMGGLSREFLTNLKLNPKDIAIIDTEAGVEHLGRGVAGNVDIVLAVIDPSYESVKLSKKIVEMAKEGGKTVYFVINKTDSKTAESLAAQIGKEQVISILPFNSSIQKKGLTGDELDLKIGSVSVISQFVIQNCANEAK
ncbi:MAG: AAA family ATPase [Candidatus Bathyarchaeia archaeon]|jgi:CO dehydrogenase maturation factor